jgi:hypothetical protein|tara:strand:+ start:49 stop:228 length:180 start_codon:yes stop_codon:yes gene_type:complete
MHAVSLLDLDVSKHTDVFSVQVLIASLLIISESISKNIVVEAPQTSNSREESEGVSSHD